MTDAQKIVDHVRDYLTPATRTIRKIRSGLTPFAQYIEDCRPSATNPLGETDISLVIYELSKRDDEAHVASFGFQQTIAQDLGRIFLFNHALAMGMPVKHLGCEWNILRMCTTDTNNPDGKMWFYTCTEKT